MDGAGLHVRMSSWLTGQCTHVTLLFLAKSFLLSTGFSNTGRGWICDTSGSSEGRGSLSGGVQWYLCRGQLAWWGLTMSFTNVNYSLQDMSDVKVCVSSLVDFQIIATNNS